MFERIVRLLAKTVSELRRSMLLLGHAEVGAPWAELPGARVADSRGQDPRPVLALA